MDDGQAFVFLKEAKKYGIALGLSNIQNLMAYLGNVQEKLQMIHVAGTNGKGSVCAMLSSILKAAGYKTGTYMSPAVFEYEEIYQINGENISKERLEEVLTKVKAACKKMLADGLAHPTVFEIETAAAFCYFYEEQCDYVVLETGMGGATDATNVILKPCLSVLTSIGYDHMAFLGNTLPEIAEVKAGIIKDKCPCVMAWQQPEVVEVIKKAALSKKSPLYLTKENIILNFQYNAPGSTFDYIEQPDGKMIHGTTSLTGEYQRENIACVMTAVQALRNQGVVISGDALLEGLRNVKPAGRMERICELPEFYIDGAHNEGAAILLKKTVQNCFTNRQIVYIIGVLADKAYKEVLKLMLPLAAHVVTVTPDHPRALDGALLAKEVQTYGVPVYAAADMGDAVRQAAKDAGETGIVLAFGSLSYLGALKHAVGQNGDRQDGSG